jgi:hypothetical protein
LNKEKPPIYWAGTQDQPFPKEKYRI